MNPRWVCARLHRGKGCVAAQAKQRKCGRLGCFDARLARHWAVWHFWCWLPWQRVALETPLRSAV